MLTSPCSKSVSTRCASSSTSWSASGIGTRISRESRVESRELGSRCAALAVAFVAGCAGARIEWRGVALVSEGGSSRESAIAGAIERGKFLESARIVLDRTFEKVGFHGMPFVIEAGDQRAILLESGHASLLISFDAELGETP